MAGRNAEFQADLEAITAHVAAQHHNTHGGSSFFAHGGESATSGYAVGGAGIPETVIDRPTLTPDEYQTHRDRVRRGTKDPGAVVGTWVEDGKSILDASTVVPSRHSAKRLQKERGERAVFNLTKGREEDLS